MQISASLKLIFAAALLLPILTFAEVRFSDNHVWRRAKTIGDGQQVFSLESSYQDNAQRFSADSHVEPLGAQFKRPMTWNQLARTKSGNNPAVTAYAQNNGLRDNDVAAVADYQVSEQQIGLELNWAYGLTKSWMIGIEVPANYTVTRVSQNVDTSMTQATARKTARSLAGQQLAGDGYSQLPTQKQAWDVADVTLMSQFEFMQTYHWTWALQQMVRFPTAQNPSVDNYIQTSEDQGPVDLGLSSLLDYRFRQAIIGFRFGYVAQLPDTARMHAPGADTADIDPVVHRDLGDWGWVAVDTEYHLIRQLDFTAQYSFLDKAKDRYSGTAFTQEEYDELAANTDQRLHEGRVGLLYRVGDASTRNGITNKWLVSLDYTYPFIGTNSTDAAMTSVEVINYF